jgi:predicted nucleic acid-binding protein
MTSSGAFTAMIEGARDIVCDTGPIIHLDELGCLDLLADFTEIILPVSVVEEIEKHRPVALTVKLPFRVLRAHNPPDERLAAMCSIFALDRGETEALIIMENYPAAIFLTDDASARMVAERMGFRVHGTIGVLARAIRRGQKNPEEVLSIIGSIPSKSTLFVKSALLKEIALRIKKESNI